ncbi:MAG: hypothetical protein ACTHW7_09685 [Actinomycetaceae bacterium]
MTRAGRPGPGRDRSTAPFLAHLEPRDPHAAEFARRLIDSGWQVVSCRGPEQMDVWELLLRRRSWRVRLGSSGG